MKGLLGFVAVLGTSSLRVRMSKQGSVFIFATLPGLVGVEDPVAKEADISDDVARTDEEESLLLDRRWVEFVGAIC